MTGAAAGFGPIEYKAIVARIGEPEPASPDALKHAWPCGCIEEFRGFGSRTWYPSARDLPKAIEAMGFE